MKITRKEIMWLVVVIFGISIAAYYLYFLSPTLDKIDTLKVTIEQKQMRILSMQTSIDQIDNIKNEIAVMEAELEKQSENIPEGISQPLQLVAVTNILNGKCSSTVIGFNQNEQEYENYQKNVVELSFSSSYENLLLILQEFQDLSMLNQIVSLNIQLTPDLLTYYTGILEGNYLLVGMSVEFYSFYAVEGTPPLEKQPFEDSPVEYKNPFKATLN